MVAIEARTTVLAARPTLPEVTPQISEMSPVSPTENTSGETTLFYQPRLAGRRYLGRRPLDTTGPGGRDNHMPENPFDPNTNPLSAKRSFGLDKRDGILEASDVKARTTNR